MAYADKELDTSIYRRKTEPLLFGYVAKKEFATKQLASFVTFLTAYGISKAVSLAILFIAASTFGIPLGWLTLECVGLLLWRMYYGNWRMYRHGADGIGISLLGHLCWYLCLLAAPFPIIRNTALLTPRIYCCGLLYMVISNFLMIGLSYHAFNTNLYLTENVAWLALSISTLIAIVSGGIFVSYVPESHRKTFYEVKTFKEHVATYVWNEKPFVIDHKHREVDTKEGVRALLSVKYSIHYLPTELLMEFYGRNWAKVACRSPREFVGG